jgi:SAM-dependent methyltransferase
MKMGKAYLPENKGLPDNLVWSKVAEGYSLSFTVAEEMLAGELAQLFAELGTGKEASLLELGCGSGHLSGLLAREGYDVTLLDFCRQALVKAKGFFQKYSLVGCFLEGDILDLPNLERKYDIVWNSGVMEHFDDAHLLNAFSGIQQAVKHYFVFVVPNPLSLPYLLVRYLIMREGKWNYGREYLRENYEELLEAAGYRLVGKRYLGWGLTREHLDSVCANPVASQIFAELCENGLIPGESAYLTAYIAEVARGSEGGKHRLRDDGSLSEYKTRVFDLTAGINGMVSRFEQVKAENIELQLQIANCDRERQAFLAAEKAMLAGMEEKMQIISRLVQENQLLHQEIEKLKGTQL